MIQIMIVEDEPLVRVGLRSIFDHKESGFEVCAEAANGMDALKLLKERHPDIILLDIKMPQMDGIEFLTEKKKLGDATPVIVLSCHGEYEFVREAMKLGARDYILKLSAKPQDLIAMMEQIRDEPVQSVRKETGSAGAAPEIDSPDSQWKKRQRSEIAAAVNFIAEHYSEYIGLNDIAARLHMSTSRFCVLFKEGTGKTFIDYLNLVRIQKAEELLMYSDFTVYEIASRVGFNSTNYFSKLFKRNTGRFPSEYRKPQ